MQTGLMSTVAFVSPFVWHCLFYVTFNTLPDFAVTLALLCVRPCRYPALLAICNGEESSIQRYEGDFKSGPITKFLEQYSGGQKCSSSELLSVQWE